MLISGLRPLKSRLQAKDNYVKKYCITALNQEGYTHGLIQRKSFPHRINILVHSEMLISHLPDSWG